MFPLLIELSFESAAGRLALGGAVLALAALVALAAALEAPDPARRGRRAAAFFAGALLLGAPLAGVLAARGLKVYSYGALIGLGLLLACALAAVRARRGGPLRPDLAVEAVFAALVGGLLGARLLDAGVDWPRYAARPALLLDPGAGYVFQGGVLGGLLAVALYARARRVAPLALFDLLAPALALGHALGRLGCLGAGCCWGALAGPGHAWALSYPGPLSAAWQSERGDHRLVDAQTHAPLPLRPRTDAAGRFLGGWDDPATGAALASPPAGALELAAEAARTGRTLPRLPVQVAEALGELALLAALLGRRPGRPGQLSGAWLAGYSLLRLLTERWRGDEERGRLLGELAAWYNLSTGSALALALLAAGLALWWRAARSTAAPAPTSA